MQQQVTFPSGVVEYIYAGKAGQGAAVFAQLAQQHGRQHVVIITDNVVGELYAQLFKGYRTIMLPFGESNKNLDTIEVLARQLLQLEAARNTLIIGVGGGVVTDTVGFLAAIYMRGVAFGFVPTTLLGMVDAAVGGKNGVNLGLNKNLLGTILQPAFIYYDTAFLETLPNVEWSNGFAEVIKYACIFDAALFDELVSNSISFYKQDHTALQALREKCVAWKNKTVIEDAKETGIRKLLNFGHTAAHAIENLYELPHGKAVAVGMVIACMISEEVAGLDKAVTAKVKKLLQQYHLPVSLSLDAHKAMDILRMDKKRNDDKIDYIVLEKAGHAMIQSLPFDVIEKALTAYASHN